MNRKLFYLFVITLLLFCACQKKEENPTLTSDVGNVHPYDHEIEFGEEYPLQGYLSYSEDYSGLLPAVILVHGSGANDRNSAVGNTKIFADIAHALAAEGIVVLRYDKRTYIYGQEIANGDFSTFTVQQETIDDVLLAKEFLLSQELVDPERIYLLGHSMGAMLAPEIARQTDFAGIIMLAGTPRTMIDVMVSQMEDALEITEVNFEKKQLENNIELISSIKHMTEDESKNLFLGSMYGYYLWDFEKYDSLGILEEIEIPVLIMQGSEDFQVKVERDYQLYVNALGDNDNIEFKLYQDLNHLFMPSFGENQYTVLEYNEENHVEQQVLNDLIDFIINNGK